MDWPRRLSPPPSGRSQVLIQEARPIHEPYKAHLSRKNFASHVPAYINTDACAE
jgi:hypothetical protein